MTKSELLKNIRNELASGEFPGTRRVLDLLDVLITQGGATLGDVTKMNEMRTALEKANFKALRGTFRYEKEHYPIQDFYAREVVKGSDGNWTIVQRGKVVSNSRAYNYKECKR